MGDAEIWTDVDSLAAAIDAAPDTIDLRSAYLAEARIVLGEELVEQLGWPLAGIELGKRNMLAEMKGRLRYPTTHELVALATAKRLLARYPYALRSGWQSFDSMWMSNNFRDLDPSHIQFSWAVRAARAVLGLSDEIPPRPAAYAAAAVTSDFPRPEFP